MAYLDRVTPVVDLTISRLASQRFLVDPISGEKFSRQTSIISSAYKRHGAILEVAIRESLRESNRHQVWREDAFKRRSLLQNLIFERDAFKIAAGAFNLRPLTRGSHERRLWE
jgi:hypothetical protein